MVSFGDCVVFGGCGWTGSFLVATLRRLSASLGIRAVYAVDIRPPSAPLQHLHEGVEYRCCDIADVADVNRVLNALNPTVVFHLASIIDLRVHPTESIDKVNVGGTDNIIAALRAAPASCRRFLVYTSTIDVVSHTWGVANADETFPYSDKEPSNEYKRTKIMAEKAVLRADCDGLRTVALRPGHIYGPGDPILAYVLASPVGVGPQQSLMSFVYVQNCAYCHVLAACALMEESEAAGRSPGLGPVRGRAFFVTDFDDNFSDFYCRLGGKNRVCVRLSWWVVAFVVAVVEILEHILYYSLNASCQHPVTGISRGILEACGHLTATSVKARRELYYGRKALQVSRARGRMDGNMSSVGVEQAVQTTRNFYVTGRVQFKEFD